MQKKKEKFLVNNLENSNPKKKSNNLEIINNMPGPAPSKIKEKCK